MAKKTASDQLIAINAKYQKSIDGYIKSKQFEIVAMSAMNDFIKRVKRGYMPDMSKIPGLSDSYMELRERYKKNLGKLAKVKLSNATATGQMLDSIVWEITSVGFALVIRDTARSKELTGKDSKLNNAEVAGYYALIRPIFDFSEPELKRIIRNIRTDLIKTITKSK